MNEPFPLPPLVVAPSALPWEPKSGVYGRSVYSPAHGLPIIDCRAYAYSMREGRQPGPTMDEARVNASLVCRAVNQHAELMLALLDLIRYVEKHDGLTHDRFQKIKETAAIADFRYDDFDLRR